MPKRLVEFFLIDILIALDTVSRKTKGMQISDDLLHDEDAWLSVTRSLEIVGEAIKYVLDSDTIDKNFIKPSWRYVVDFRNVVAHEYFGLNADQIFDIAKKGAPKLELEVIDLLKKLPDKKMLTWVIEETKIELSESRRAMSVEYLESLQIKLGL